MGGVSQGPHHMDTKTHPTFPLSRERHAAGRFLPRRRQEAAVAEVELLVEAAIGWHPQPRDTQVVVPHCFQPDSFSQGDAASGCTW